MRRGRPASFTLALVLVILTVVFSSSCGESESEQGGGRIGVVVTIAPQAVMVQRIGAEKVDVTVMVPQGASPHTYEITPAQMKKVADARLYLKVGSGVDFEMAWMDTIVDQNKNMTVIDCSSGITLIEMTAQDDHDGEAQENTEADSHRGLDPHIWMSAHNAQIMVGNICDGLIQIDQQSQAYYEQNRDAYLKELMQVDREIREGLTGIENRVFMVYHPSFGYFAAEYDLMMLPIEAEGKEPTAKGLVRLIDQAQEYNIQVIFASPQVNRDSAKVIADQIDGSVVIIDPLAEDYLENMRHLMEELANAMQ